MADEIPVTFTEDIPKIERVGAGRRSSKYDDLLEACVQNVGKAAKITVDKQGQASSRASSIRTAAERHEAEVNGDGVFIVATRSGGENEFFVYVKYVEAGTDEAAEELQRRKDAEVRAAKRASQPKDPNAPKKVRKVTRKAG